MNLAVYTVIIVIGGVLLVRSLVRTWGTPRPRKPSINSGRAEKAALTGGLLAALFMAGRHNHHNRRDYWT